VALGSHLEESCNRYAAELGESAYAVLNAATEFASHPPDNRHIHRDRHSLQRLAGTWLTTFSQQCRQSDFALDRYLAEMDASSVAATAAIASHPEYTVI
jgi:hypothetical protein